MHLAGSLIVCLKEYLMLQFCSEKEKKGRLCRMRECLWWICCIEGYLDLKVYACMHCLISNNYCCSSDFHPKEAQETQLVAVEASSIEILREKSHE